jgi:hypothetical protein
MPSVLLLFWFCFCDRLSHYLGLGWSQTYDPASWQHTRLVESFLFHLFFYNQEWMLDLGKYFFLIYWDDYVVFFFFFLFFFWDSVLLNSTGWLWTHYIAQAGLKLMILLPQCPDAGIIGLSHYTQACFFF